MYVGTMIQNTCRRMAGVGAALMLMAFAGLATAHVASAQYGTIQGRVTERGTNEALPGVNVSLLGTTMGTVTNVDGRYAIIGVRPGTYTIVASFVGFETVRVENVRVQIDLTTSLDIQIGEQVIEGEEVVVVAQRPMVQRDLTATTSVVSGEEVRALPVDNFSDVVNLQAGVVNGHFRGGRLGEVGYWVDGLPVTDVFDGSLGVGIENSMVEEVQVVTGAFNAEYGQAMSGIVNVVTRDGTNNFQGGFSSFTGDYISNRSSRFRGIDEFSPVGVRNVEADFSGPVIRNRLFFFASGRFFSNDGWLHGQRVFGFDDVGFDNTGRMTLANTSGSGDSTFVSLNPYERLGGTAKLTWRASNKIRVSANVIAGQEDFRNYDHGLVFHPDAQLQRYRRNHTAFLKWTHTLTSSLFYEVGVTNTVSRYRHYMFEDIQSPEYRDYRFFGHRESLHFSNFAVGGTDNNRFERETQTWLVKADMTSLLDRHNLVKAGLEMRLHELSYMDQFVEVEGDQREIVTRGTYTVNPIEVSGYLQDKIEFGSIIINAGVRFDYFDARGEVLADPRDTRNFFSIGDNPRYNLEEGEGTVASSSNWQFSPRLGVAFPITAGGVIHFSYGYFFQTPNFELLFRNPQFNLDRVGSGLVGLVGNSNLRPERTINGEIGLKQELTSTSAIEVTAYFRDIRDLAGSATEPIQLYSNERYGMLLNSDFGFVRGVVLRYNQRFGPRFFVNADYTFQIAKGNASDPAQVYNAAAARQQLEQQIVSLDWDQRQTVNLSGSYVGPGNWGMAFVARMGTGLPYTPDLTTLQTGVILPTTIPLNSETRPMTYNIDLNAYKNFRLVGGEAQLFARVDNLFDTGNEFGVFGTTGRATYSLQKNVDAGNFQGDRAFLDAWYNRPDFFSEPRRVVLGLSYRF
jgi:outer membrane receptor protein involved in Fe transport